MRLHRPGLVLLVSALFALAWTDPRGTAGEAAGLALVALSAVALAVLVVGILPTWVAKIGIIVWAAVDLTVALMQRLEEASRPIIEAAPAVGPQLQRVVLGTASMEYADLFVAAAFGAVLAVERRRRGGAALLVAVLAVASSFFFLVTDALPATVPIALALVLEEIRLHASRADLLELARRAGGRTPAPDK
jgi:prepilin signal peptidase PulO-like enzyme (type II secretory pathway)